MRRKTGVAVLLLAGAIVPAASAHISPSPSSAPAGQTTIVGFTIGHGCDGSPTRSVSIQIPAGVTSAKPKPKPGWRVTIQRGKLPVPVRDTDGNKITTGVRSVTWSGGGLPDSLFDTFELRLAMPNTPGKTVYFPLVQRCSRGLYRWIKIPVAGKAEPDTPAPGVALVKSSGSHD